jgi:hypothetical protein
MALDSEYASYARKLMSKACYDAFYVYIVHGDQARASTFAKRLSKASSLTMRYSNLL